MKSILLSSTMMIAAATAVPAHAQDAQPQEEVGGIEEIVGTDASEVTPEKNFVDDLDIDSLSMVEIAVAAQDKFGVEIPDDQLKDLKTVQDVITFIQK